MLRWWLLITIVAIVFGGANAAIVRAAPWKVIGYTPYTDIISNEIGWENFGFSLTMSPDGRQVAWYPAQRDAICRMNTATYDQTCTPLPSDVAYVQYNAALVWSGDGQQLFFAGHADQYSVDESELWVYNPAAETFTPILAREPQAGAQYFHYWWQGTALYATQYRTNSTFELIRAPGHQMVYHISPTTLTAEPLFDLNDVLSKGVRDARVAINSAGTLLAVLETDFTDVSQGNLTVVDAATGDVRLQLNVATMRDGIPAWHDNPIGFTDVHWTPAGTHVVISTASHTAYYDVIVARALMIEVNTGAITPIIDLSDLPAATYYHDARNPYHNTITPDGRFYLTVERTRSAAFGLAMYARSVPPDDMPPLLVEDLLRLGCGPSFFTVTFKDGDVQRDYLLPLTVACGE